LAVVIIEDGSGSGLAGVASRCTVGKETATLDAPKAVFCWGCGADVEKRCGRRLFWRCDEKVANVGGAVARKKLVEQDVVKLLAQCPQNLFPGKPVNR
jgi:hypothetical protein